LHQIVANNIVIWSYDPTAESFYGWRDLSLFIMPAESEIELSVRVLALSDPRGNAEWWEASQLAFRDFRMVPCP